MGALPNQPKPPQAKTRSAESKSKPKPPETQHQKQVSKPIQSCPLQVQSPCDVDKLVLYVTIDDEKVPAMESTGGLRNTPVQGVKSKEVLRLLHTYDLVCDAIAQAPSPEDPSPDEKVKIAATAYFHGRQCSKHEHGVFTLKPLTPAAELKGGAQVKRKQGAASIEFEAREYFANSARFDWGLREGKGVVALFDIIQGAWSLATPKLLEYRAEACGTREKGKVDPRRQLAALVRIYRKDTYTLGFKIPALRKLSHSREGQRDVLLKDPYTRRSSTESRVWGSLSSSSSAQSSGTGVLANYDFSRERWSGGRGERHSSTRSVQGGSVTETYSHQHSDRKGVEYKDVDGVHSVDDIHSMLQQSKQGFELILKRNDKEWEVPFNKDKLIKSVQKTWEEIRKIQESLRKLPQMGWKFEFTLSIFAGQFVVQFGPEVDESRLLANGRYHPVDWVATAKFKLTLVDIKLEASFGIEWTVIGTGFCAKVAGELSFSAAIEGSLKVTLDNPSASLVPKLTSKLAFRAGAYAKVAGWSIVDASVSVELAVELNDGKLLLELDKGLRLTGSLELKPVFLKGYLKASWRTPAEPMDPYPLIQGRTLYTFG